MRYDIFPQIPRPAPLQVENLVLAWPIMAHRSRRRVQEMEYGRTRTVLYVEAEREGLEIRLAAAC